MTRPQSAIAATGLRKAYGEHLVLDGVDLDVAEGTIFALLGPNGAGKTTVVHILSTLIGADAGEIRVAGNDPARFPDAVRAAIGVTGQFSAVDNLLTGEENLILMADLHHLDRLEGRRRASDLLERFDLVDAATKTAATYSGGMRRRLDLAMGLVGDPRIVFLDEPTTGLDPRSRRTMWQIIRDLAAGGVTVFLTTQYLPAGLADRPPAPVRLCVRRHARRRTRGLLRRPGRLRRLRHARDHAHHRGLRGAGDGDIGRDGHDRGHHRAVSHHGHRPRLGADRARRRQHEPDDAQPGGRHRCRTAHRVPTDRRRGRVDRGRRRRGDDHLRAHLAVGCARHGEQERRDREQPPHAAAAPAVPRQWLRPHRLDARRDALVRREPALHPDHGDRARTADGLPDRQQRRPRRGLVRRDRAGGIPVGPGL
jgi:ABC-2 type transport system ATP-binding protein